MDKDILAVIAEMLKKQDQTNDTLNAFMGAATTYAKGTNERLDGINEHLGGIDERLGGIDDQLVNINDRLGGINERLVETNTILRDFTSISVKQWEQQHLFNEHIHNKVDKMSSFEARIKHLEEMEERLIKIERLLKAS